MAGGEVIDAMNTPSGIGLAVLAAGLSMIVLAVSGLPALWHQALARRRWRRMIRHVWGRIEVERAIRATTPEYLPEYRRLRRSLWHDGP